MIYEDGAAYLYRLDGHPTQTRPLLTVVAPATERDRPGCFRGYLRDAGSGNGP